MKIPHGIAVYGDRVYVADRNNSRIQVFDLNLNFQKYITGIGQPWSVQVTPKYIYSGDGTGKIYRLDHDGKLLGWAQTSLGQGQTGCLIHSLQAEGDNVLYKGSCSLWNIEKITFKEWCSLLPPTKVQGVALLLPPKHVMTGLDPAIHLTVGNASGLCLHSGKQ